MQHVGAYRVDVTNRRRPLATRAFRQAGHGHRNPEPGTRNPEPGTRNPEPGTIDIALKVSTCQRTKAGVCELHGTNTLWS